VSGKIVFVASVVLAAAVYGAAVGLLTFGLLEAFTR
jgi:hypothetical protein